MNPLYCLNQIVWTKIEGSSWWPARIVYIYLEEQIIYRVNYFGDYSFAYLLEQHIKSFQVYKPQFKPKELKNIQLKKAIQTATRKSNETISITFQIDNPKIEQQFVSTEIKQNSKEQKQGESIFQKIIQYQNTLKLRDRKHKMITKAKNRLIVQLLEYYHLSKVNRKKKRAIKMPEYQQPVLTEKQYKIECTKRFYYKLKTFTKEYDKAKLDCLDIMKRIDEKSSTQPNTYKSIFLTAMRTLGQQDNLTVQERILNVIGSIEGKVENKIESSLTLCLIQNQ